MKFKPCQDLFILIVKRLLWRGVRAGRRSTIGNRVCPEGYQEFESLPLRQNFQGFCAYCIRPFFTFFSFSYVMPSKMDAAPVFTHPCGYRPFVRVASPEKPFCFGIFCGAWRHVSFKRTRAGLWLFLQANTQDCFCGG